MQKRRILLFILLLINFPFLTFTYAQEYTLPETLKWQIITNNQNSGNRVTYFLGFPEAVYPSAGHGLPYFRKTLPLSSPGSLTVNIRDAVYEPVPADSLLTVASYLLPREIKIEKAVKYAGMEPMAVINFMPLRFNAETGKAEKLVSFTLDIDVQATGMGHSIRKLQKKDEDESVLAKGEWVKIGVTETGIYKLDHAFLSSLGLNIQGDALKRLQIYGKPGGMLPQANDIARDKDLLENAIWVSDDNNNFDGNDHVLFYARGPVSWHLDSASKRFRHQANYYSDTSYYFITVGSDPGKRIGTQASSSLPATQDITSFTAYAHHEKDELTDIMKYLKGGREWYGEIFRSFSETQISRSFQFSFPQIKTDEDSYIRTAYAARASAKSRFQTKINGTLVKTSYIDEADLSYYLAPYAYQTTEETAFKPNSANLDVTATFIKPNPDAIGWLNYIEINARCRLEYAPGQFGFRNVQSFGPGMVNRYMISGAPANGSMKIWDVTDFHNVKLQEGQLNGSNFEFKAPAETVREYISFDGNGFLTPYNYGKVRNQNLHGLEQAEMVIVAYPDFVNAANRLADFHRQHDGFTVHVVTPWQIYNEFSSGTQDISAIRDFMKMFYDRAQNPDEAPRYLLLFGDASYDYKYRTSPNTNFVPTYESYNSLAPLSSYASDDYYGYLNDDEGEWLEGAVNNDQLDIGIGRLPVQTPEQAEAMVDKVVRYSDPRSLGDWRNTLTFVADDENDAEFVRQCEALSRLAISENPAFNLNKIYMDAFKQISTSNGAKYPEATERITKSVESGSLIIDYIGHGSEVRLAHESVLQISDINSWKNPYNMPLFITATCEFSRFDDPDRVSAGEQVLLRAEGGAIGMFTTTRVVYIAQNQTLNVNIMKDNLLKYRNGEPPRLGDILMTGKNRYTSENNRNFTLLGDPAVQLALPEHRVKLTSIEGPDGQNTDTLSALSLVTVKGRIEDVDGSALNSFNGTLYPVVYDKATSRKTLVNDPDSRPQQTFSTQESIIYKGQASVKNGEFTFSFVVPKDISFKHGAGKFSFYAQNGVTDAHGYDDSVVVGGSSPDPYIDDKGPEVRLFMNDTNFVRGGLVDENPVLLALVQDDIGINTVGTGIGHELTAVLNGGETIILNPYYEADKDNYRKGTIRYPFYKLADGEYTLNIKVWDVANNSTTASTEFIVASSSKLVIDKILNYPNPFRDKTRFQFEHNRPDENLNVYIDIYSLSGQLVKRIRATVNGDGTRSTTVEWDGDNEHGTPVSSGMYVYQLTVETQDGQKAHKSQKLVVIK